MAIPTDELTRLSTGAPTGYNNDPFNASTNPYGFDDGGYITNFFAALNDMIVVANWVVTEIGPILDITEEIEALGAIVAELQTLAGIAPDVQTLAALDTEVAALAAIAADITTVATNAAAVTAVATDIAKVAAVEAALTDIEAVADALGNISTIIGMAADIATVAARASDIALLADIEDGTTATGAIQTVAGIATAVSNVSTNSADVVAVAGALGDVNTVAGISGDVTALGPIAADVTAVAEISADVETAADNISAIIAAPAAAVAARKSVRHILVDLTSTADSHPGAGHLRFSIDINAASPGATGTLYHDIADADEGDITGWVESWDDVINATGRGIITLVNETDPSISLALRITGSVSSGTGYRKAPFTLLQKSGTIVDEDEFTESFAPSGNDGDAIGGGATIIGAVTAGDLLQAIDETTMESAGKGIADLFDKTSETLDDIPDGSTYVRYTAAEQTKLSGVEASADVTDAGNVGSSIHGSTAKSTPVDADTVPLIDSAASNVLKKVTWANIKATLKTYFDTLYSAVGHTHAWSAITGKPTTVSGAGLTDAVTLTGSEVLTNKTLTTPILTLEQGTSVAPTAEGRIAWNTDDNKLKIGDGSGTATITPDGLRYADTITALKAFATAGLATGDLVNMRGFDSASDGCGGVFRYNSGTAPTNTLDGVIFANTAGGYWTRVDAFTGPIHTHWVGIRPEAAPSAASFDVGGFASNNRTRWNNMTTFAAVELLAVLASDKAGLVTQSVYVDPGVHDFFGGTLNLPDCVGLTGAGRGVATLRANITSGTFIQVGTVGDYTTTSSVESAFADFSNVSVINFTQSTGTDYGIVFSNTFRGTDCHHIFVMNFGTNVLLDAFGMNFSNNWLQYGYTSNLEVGPRANSMEIALCRFDDQRATSGINVDIEEAGAARGILVRRCDIQRSYGKALLFKDVASGAVRDCFFEGNNRSDGSHPDIWIEGAGVDNFVVDGCYFTGAARLGATTCKAINIRSNVTSAARFQITNNMVADSGGSGTFVNFVDVDANVAMEIFYDNNIISGSATNSFPGSVIVKGPMVLESYTSSALASGSAVSLTTNITANVITLALGVGTWEIVGAVIFTTAGTTNVAKVFGSISDTSATLSSDIATVSTGGVVPGSSSNAFALHVTARITMAAAGNVYLAARGTFTVSTLSAYGSIRARRVA